MAEFSLVAFQDQVGEEYSRIYNQGIGRHRKRSWAAAHHKFFDKLLALGYGEDLALQILRDAVDVAKLVAISDEV